MTSEHWKRSEPELRQPEFYLTHMGRIWVAMVALFVLGLVLWTITGPLGFVVCVVGMGLPCSRWERNYRDYLDSMFRAGLRPCGHACIPASDDLRDRARRPHKSRATGSRPSLIRSAIRSARRRGAATVIVTTSPALNT
jgi:hypothetical protein